MKRRTVSLLLTLAMAVSCLTAALEKWTGTGSEVLRETEK